MGFYFGSGVRSERNFIICAIFLFFNCRSSGSVGCQRGLFQCDNFRCIAQEWKCDGVDDCGDNSDEHVALCPSALENCDDKFKCDNKEVCIPQDLVCDSHPDCSDASDEINCAPEIRCKDNEHMCNDKVTCIVEHHLCDHIQDCPDNSDENNCPSENKNRCDMTNEKFLCEDRKKCIDITKACDGSTDCTDNSDEGPACNMICQKSECSHQCYATPFKAICTCPEGYLLQLDNSTCQDVNECEWMPEKPCSQICVNSPGGFYCTCHKEYRLKENGRQCTVDDRIEPVLLYAKKNDIRKLYMKSKKYDEIVNDLENVVDIAYDASDNRVYWIDEVEKRVYFTSIGGSGDSVFKTTVVAVGLVKPEKIAVDWISRKLYVADSGRGQILACEISIMECVVVVSNLHAVKDIVLNPNKRKMYWVEWGDISKICSSSMDGKDRQIFVEVKSGKPIGLVIDYETDILYWIDLIYQEVEYINLDGSNRKILLSNLIQKPSTIAVFEDNIIWSHKGSQGSIMMANKFTGKSKSTLIDQARNTRAITMAHPVLQKTGVNICSVSPCSDVCLLSYREPGYSCACPEHLVLGADQQTCESNPDSVHIIAATKSNIFKISTEFIGVKPEQQNLVNHLYHVTDIDINPVTNEVVFIEDKSELSSVSSDPYGRANPKMILDEGFNGNCLSVDWSGKNVFWANGQKRSVEIVKIDGTARVVLQQHHKEKPRSILVDPATGFMYISYVGNESMIEKCNMDATDCFILYEMAGAALSLTLDDAGQRLFWIDDKTGHIESISATSGKYRKVHTRNYSNPPHSFAIHGNLVYWSGKMEPTVYVMNMSDPSSDSLIFFQGLSDPPLLAILRKKKSTSGLTGCSSSNGGCSHICFALPEGQRSCSCPKDLKLSLDRRSCITETEVFQCGREETMCMSKDQCVSSVDKCDGHRDCFDGSDEVGCTLSSAICDTEDILCANGKECINKLFRCDEDFDCIDGSDEKNCDCRVLGKFQCGSGECVKLSDLCDAHADCEDESDESKCKTPEICDFDDFECEDGTCIRDTQKCDAHYDCSDKSDEKDCPIILHQCTMSEIQCRDGACISKSLWCNQIADCSDGSDEKNCPTIVETVQHCSWGSFRCNDGECVPAGYRCNNVADCQDSSDEDNCSHIIVACDYHSFSCKSGQCIDRDYRCNNIHDCDDGSDELNCQNVLVKSCNIEDMSFQCEDMSCILLLSKCNGKSDCLDGSDEKNCPDSVISATRTTDSPVMMVPVLHTADIQHQLVTYPPEFPMRPVDECAVLVKACSQKCDDLENGYRCYCAPGYKMNADNSCVSPGGAVYLIVTSNNHIRFSTLNGSFLKNAREDDTFGRITSLDVHISMDTIYWADNMDKFYSLKIDEMETKNFGKKFGAVEGIAVDWIGNNVYVCEKQNQRITVCAMKNGLKYCVPIIKNGLVAPRSIAVHPLKGLMFWSDLGSRKKIDSSWMDGRNRRTIVKNLMWPNGITVDLAADLLFWTDGHSDLIEGARLDGTHRFTVKLRRSMQPYAISVFEDNLFVSNWRDNTVDRMNKYGVGNATTLENLFQPTGLKIYSALIQPPVSGINFCSQLSCVQICLLSPAAAECVCSVGYIKGMQGNACQELKLNVCTKTFCQNNGVCMKTRDVEHCRCASGFTGKYCQIKIGRSTPLIIQTTTEKDVPKIKGLPESKEPVEIAKGPMGPIGVKDKPVTETEPVKSKSKLWLIGLFICLILVIGGMAAIYYMKRRRQNTGFNRLIHYCHPSKHEEVVDLVSDNVAFGNPNFQDYDNINNNMTYKKFQDDDTDSIDSAFSSHYGNTTRESNRI